jgi:hypothetical protein
MARDPEIRHEHAELLEGLRCVTDDEAISEPMLEELLHLGLVLINHRGAVQITSDGRKFLLADPS